MKIIVTGASGFIGKYLCSYLWSKGNEIINIDRKEGKEIEDIFHINERIDAIVHLAAQTSVFNTNIDQIKKDNIDSFIKVVEYSNKRNVRLIYASSSSAHNITSMYGISKQFNENYACLYANNATGIRFHNVYGKNPRKGTLLSNLLENNATLYQSGHAIRHFTHINNVLQCIESNLVRGEKLINCFNPIPDSILKFATLVRKYASVEYQITETKLKGDKFVQVVDETLPNYDTKYIGIEEGIKLSI